MDLILWRHAEAEALANATADPERHLTGRGLRHAEIMGQWLRDRLPRKTRVLAGPTVRAQQTAEVLGIPYQITRDLAMGADPARMLGAAEWPDFGGAVVLVGHQPGLGRLAALLLGGEEANWSIRKGSVWWFSNRVRMDETQTVLRTVMQPDLIK